ncbi:MAG: hypothetical protein ACRDMU_03800 [Gaiellaceae bacterium]
MRKRWVGGLGLAVVLGATAAAIAAGGGPRIDQVEASITYTHAQIAERFCEGPEGEFAEQRVVASGTATGDPRLSGDAVLTITLLNESATGESFQQGTLVIRDPDTGRKKVVARVADGGVAEIFQGSLVGSVQPGGWQLFANWRTIFRPNGSITAQIGGEAADGRLPAVVIKGRCTGPFDRFEVDLPAPEDAAAARSASARHVGWIKG